MKKIFISLAAFVAVSLALVSCHNNSVFNQDPRRDFLCKHYG